VSKVLRLDKKRLDEFVAALFSRYRLFGPVDIGGLMRFAEVESAGALRLGIVNPDESAKGIFFPQTETLLTGNQGEVVPTQEPDRPIAVIGIRPCDARGLAMLDKVFGTGEHSDPYWTRRYRNALIVTMGCSTPRAGCFCNWLGSGPFSTEGSDIALTDIGDAILLDPRSEKGMDLLKGVGCDEVSAADLRKSADIKQRAESSMPGKVDVSSLKSALDRAWDSPLWEELAGKCLSCAACAYLCPTCHCFDIQDEKAPGTNQCRRIRIWDSCMAPLFTKEASGHNPRPTGKERLRQRVMHKFNYFVDVYGETACVGCGRCIRSCPVNLDIREVLVRFIDAG